MAYLKSPLSLLRMFVQFVWMPASQLTTHASYQFASMFSTGAASVIGYATTRLALCVVCGYMALSQNHQTKWAQLKTIVAQVAHKHKDQTVVLANF